MSHFGCFTSSLSCGRLPIQISGLFRHDNDDNTNREHSTNFGRNIVAREQRQMPDILLALSPVSAPSAESTQPCCFNFKPSPSKLQTFAADLRSSSIVVGRNKNKTCLACCCCYYRGGCCCAPSSFLVVAAVIAVVMACHSPTLSTKTRSQLLESAENARG